MAITRASVSLVGWLLLLLQLAAPTSGLRARPLVSSRTVGTRSPSRLDAHPQLLHAHRAASRAAIVLAAGGGEGENLPSEDGEESQSFKDSVIDFIREFVPTLLICLVIRILVVEPRYIPSLSMFPSFEIGDQLAVEKVTKRFAPYHRDEVIVFRPPDLFFQLSGKPPDGEALIKRIVAIGGDTVEVRCAAHAAHRVPACVLTPAAIRAATPCRCATVSCMLTATSRKSPL